MTPKKNPDRAMLRLGGALAYIHSQTGSIDSNRRRDSSDREGSQRSSSSVGHRGTQGNSNLQGGDLRTNRSGERAGRIEGHRGPEGARVTMHIESQQLGPLEIPEENIVTFHQGIPGFPDVHEFCLLEVRAGSRFKLLQCITKADLAFVVTDPLLVAPDYPMDTIRTLAAQMGFDPEEPIAVAAIVTVPPQPSRPTANLLAPIVMGIHSRLAVQLILNDSQYQVRHTM